MKKFLTILFLLCTAAVYADETGLKPVEDNYTKREVMIPMRDGVSLYTAVFEPSGMSDRPVIMLRTPYSCSPYGEGFPSVLRKDLRLFSDNGYIIVLQNVRGRYMSEGEYENIRPFNPDKTGVVTDEASDTYDTVEWILDNTSNNGNQRLHTNRKMPLEMAKDAILFLREHSVDTPEVYIGFYGGEPLLEFDMLKELVLFAEKELSGKKINYTLTTNAVLLTDYTIEFFMQYNVDLLISLDGSKESHDKNRVFAATGKGTFDSIIHKLQEVSVKYPDYFKKITINMVMDPSIDFDVYSALFKQYPFMKKVHVMSTIIDDMGAEVKNVYKESFTAKERYNIFLWYLNAFERMPSNRCSPVLSSQNSVLKEIVFSLSERKQLPQKAVPSGPCVPGEVRLMVTVEGKFILCERVSEVSEPMCIGNIKNGLDFKKIYDLINVAQTTAEQCRNCWALSLCNLCVKYSDKDNTLSPNARLSYCNMSKEHALDTLRKIAMIREMATVYGYPPIM